MNPQDLSLTFLQEAEDLLAEIETAALSLNPSVSNEESVNHIFRAFHTIKGSGSMFGFDKVAAFTHHVETLLDQVRDGTVAVTDHLPSIILAAADHIKLLLGAAQGGPAVDMNLQAALLETVVQMTQPVATSVAASKPAAQNGGTLPSWVINFHPDPNILISGGNPLLLIRDLKKLGMCIVEGRADDLPLLTEIDAEACYLSWKIQLVGSCSEVDIRDVFLFVEDGSELVITPGEAISQVSQGSPGKELTDYSTAASVQDAIVMPAPTISQVPALTDSVAASPSQAPNKEATVRVPAARLDRLVNLVGELVMNQSRLASAAEPFHSPELAGPVEEIDRLVSELRDDVLQIRMMPIGSIFGKFRRLVRDLSLQLGKEIDLVTVGEDTELDKSILDQLSEPLVHMLRNSIDHGIESPAVRREKGKATKGTIRLTAVHRGSAVVVSIEDDGGGLNRDVIRSKAISKHLIAADANLSEKEIFNLILMPGFSTAATVTSVSGRGVGMDVVKRQIDALRGSLNISSKPGKGTCMSLTLPLTLAIIDGLLVETGNSQYIIPLASVTENVELHESERLLNNGRNIVAVRGELIPYIDLRQLFKTDGAPPSISKIVLVQYEEHRVGLVVDRVLGTYQTVIQALGKFFHNIGVVSGSTIMGDGRVSLILDIASIVRMAESQGHVDVRNMENGGRIAA